MILKVSILEDINLPHLLDQLGYGNTNLYYAYKRYPLTLSKTTDSHSVNSEMIAEFKTASQVFDELLR